MSIIELSFVFFLLICNVEYAGNEYLQSQNIIAEFAFFINMNLIPVVGVVIMVVRGLCSLWHVL